jgi:hypothetical protein
MARVRAILSAVARASRRKSKLLRQVRGNNMFYAGVTLMFLGDPAALVFFMVLIALVLFLPSSGDPMTAVPRERLDLWPLTRWERYGLRLVSPLLNPLTWVILGGMVWKRVTWGLWALVAGFFLGGFTASSRRFPHPWVPKIFMGDLTQLVRKELRQLLTALDLYCALLIVIPAFYFRLTGVLPVSARVPLTGLVVVIMSTIPLTLFGLDGEGGMTRYRLWPVHGWWALAAKDIAYLLLMLLLTLPLSAAGGIAGALMALAIGQFVSVKKATRQSRWRFRTCPTLPFSVAQMLLAMLGFAAVTQWGALWVGPCIFICATSVWFCGRLFSAEIDNSSRLSSAD